MGCKTNQKENRGKCVELPFLWSIHLKNGMHLNHWISTHLDISHCSHCRYALGMGQTCGISSAIFGGRPSIFEGYHPNPTHTLPKKPWFGGSCSYIIWIP